MTAHLPDWIPATPETSPVLPRAEGRGGRVVVLLSTEGALSAGWVGTVAVDLATSWSQAGIRVVVADAGLSTPLLHEALEIPNHEGLVDALRWGVSVRRVIRRPEGRTFLALTAGTAVADPAAVMALPRWHALCAGFREAGVTLAVLVPSWEEALAAVLDEADGVVILAEPDEEPGELVAGVDAPVIAVLGRERPDDTRSSAVAAEHPTVERLQAEAPTEDGAAIETAAMAGEDAEESGASSGPRGLADEPSEVAADPVVWDLIQEETPGDEEAVSLADPLAEYDRAPAPAVAYPGDEEFVLPDPIPVPPSFEEIVEESEAPVRRSPRGAVLILLLLVVAAVAVAAWLGYLEIPGLTGDQGAAASSPPPAVATPVPATETSSVQGYSLALGAYQDGAVARERVVALGGQVPGVLFQSVPVEVEGTLYHRVLAGPAADSAAVVALASLIAEAASLDSSPWVARWTPLAFRLGEMPDREAAERRVGTLEELGVSAYVMAVDYSDGSVRYRVFAGAFGDAAEASYLSGLLDERGLSSVTLSDRTGRLPE